MPVFLSDNELKYAKGQTDDFSEAYCKKLAASIRSKLRYLSIDLDVLRASSDFGEDVKAVFGAKNEVKIEDDEF